MIRMSGKYFEELEIGMEFNHLPHRTITETDNFLFTALTHNPQPLHLDVEFAKKTQHGQIIVNSLFTFIIKLIRPLSNNYTGYAPN